MVKIGEREIAKEKFYTLKKPMKILDVNVDNIVISKSVKTKTNSKYLIGYLDKTIIPLVLIMPKMNGYIKTFKVKEGGNKLMPFCIDDEKLLEKYKAIWTKIEDLKNIKLNALPVYDDRFIKSKIRTFGGKIYTNLLSFLMILYCIRPKIYLQVYLENCAYKILQTNERLS